MIRFHRQAYGEFTCDHAIVPRKWPHFDLLFIHSGHIRLRVRETDEMELRSGEAILLYPQTPFTGNTIARTSQASVTHFSIDAGTDSLRPPFTKLARLRHGFQLYDSASGRRAEGDIHRSMKLAALTPSPLVQEMRIALLTLILAELSGQARQTNEMAGCTAFETVIRWASENLCSRPTVDDLARRAGFSSSHFRAMFRREAGRSIGAFLQDLRLREASRLLRETATPIKQVCRESGYSDLASLYHAFKRRNKITPAEYRQQHALRA